MSLPHNLARAAATDKQLNEAIDQLDAALEVPSTQAFDASKHQHHDASTGLTIYPTWRCQPSYRSATAYPARSHACSHPSRPRRLAVVDNGSQRHPEDEPAALGQAWWKLMVQEGYLPANYAELDAARKQRLSKSSLRTFDSMAQLKVRLEAGDWSCCRAKLTVMLASSTGDTTM